MSEVMNDVRSLRHYGDIVNQQHEERSLRSAKSDVKALALAIKDFPKGETITVRHLCTDGGTGLFVAASETGEHCFVLSAYRLVTVGGAWSPTVWYECYIAQGRLIEYLQLVANGLKFYCGERNIIFETDPFKIRHLYCGVIMRDLEADMGGKPLKCGYIRYPLYTEAECGFMKAQLEIYERRFPEVVAEWRKYTTDEEIMDGFTPFYDYYNEGYGEELKQWNEERWKKEGIYA